jgi:PAS domain S-box-containing protein
MHVQASGSGWETLFWLVFQRSANAIALLDEERRVVEVNESALTLLGRSRGEVMGMSIADSIRPAERARADQEWQAFLRSGEHAGTRALLRADGSEVDVEFAARLAHVGDRRLAVYVTLAGRRPSRLASPVASTRRPLSNREREVVTLIALGRETGQIAEELHISGETVRTHVRNAMSKLCAHTRAQLVAVALCTDKAIHLPRLGE